MSQVNSAVLEKIFEVKQVDHPPESLRGILQTKDYDTFTIYSDTGKPLHHFIGAKRANKCLPGDHVEWTGMHCTLELRDEYPPIVGTLELTNKSKYGLTSRGIPIYLFTPYNKAYPHFIVGCSEKDVSRNRIALITFGDWDKKSLTFPRGLLKQIIGPSGDYSAEKEALMWQSCPYVYPKFNYCPELIDNTPRVKLNGFTFNIDPEGCKDVDDVFTFEPINQIEWTVTITISDVACYVEDCSAVDILASLIGKLYMTIKVQFFVRCSLQNSQNKCAHSFQEKNLEVYLYSSDGQVLKFGMYNGLNLVSKQINPTAMKNSRALTVVINNHLPQLHRIWLKSLSRMLING